MTAVTTRDKYASAGAVLAAAIGETALLTAVGGRLARRLHRQFGTPYAPLSRRDAFVTAYMARYVVRVLRPSDRSTLRPEAIAEQRSKIERQRMRERFIREGEDMLAEVHAQRQERERQANPDTSDPVGLMEQMREQREEARQARQGRR